MDRVHLTAEETIRARLERHDAVKQNCRDSQEAAAVIIEIEKAPIRKPVFGPIKTDMPRTVDLAAEAVVLLRAHKSHQAEMKMANRTSYQDHGLVFAKEWGGCRCGKECGYLPDVRFRSS